MIIKACKFKRTKNSIWETGISFECDGDMNYRIIDKEGNIVKIDSNNISVYDAKDNTDILCINLSKLI